LPAEPQAPTLYDRSVNRDAIDTRIKDYLMIKVLIERVIAEGLEQPYEEAARKVIQQAIQSPGFISGESFRDLERPNQRIVMVTWQNRHSWERWEHSQARFDSISAFAPMLEKEERVTLLEPL
jgi:antibiotic biosynthesis monooxygenase (ABM) superfamily enzyme